MARRIPVVLMVTLLACGGRDADSPAVESPGTTAAGTTAAAGQPGAGQGGIRIVVSEGGAAGTHDRTGETVCVHNAGSWIVGYSELGELEAQAVLEGVDAAGGTTANVQLSAMFGDVMAEDEPGTMVMLAPGRSSGLTGTVTVAGETAGATVEGTTLDGVRVSATFRCSVVQR